MRFLLANALLICVTEFIPLVFSETPSATIIDISKLFRHHDYLAQKVRQRPDFRLNHEEYYHRKIVTETPPTPSTSAFISPWTSTTASLTLPTIIIVPPTNTTRLACTKALSAPNTQASNPSGMAACYNVLSLDNSTGTFQADLQLYQISPAYGDWATLQQQGMNVKLSYPNTTVASMYNSSLVKRGNELTSWLPTHEIQRYELTRRGGSPQLIADLNIVGSVDIATMQKASNQTMIKTALLPLIILSGTTANGTPISTTISAKGASFLTGVFAPASSQLITTPAKAQVTQSVLPGTRLGIFPTGLVITSVWTFLFVMAVGLGTLQRQQHRRAYRRRIKIIKEGVRGSYIF